MTLSSLAVLLTGFGLGVVHAFDADHVMAVSALSSRKPGIARTLGYSLRWALGHGGVLMLAGILLFGLGLQLPDSLVHWAEASVGLLLIGIGLMCFWRFRARGVSLVPHRHGEMEHTHLKVAGHAHGDDSIESDTHQETTDRHGPVMVGVLHGLAGSAPALALVPIVTQGQFAVAVTYLLLFSLGVMLAMCAFGLGFGGLQAWLRHQSVRAFQIGRYLVASGSVGLGGYWLSQSF